MSGFSIVTNVNSLLAQENLGRTNQLQTTTIARLTSGLRINSSADDAAGLAVANRFRSDISVLRQGVRNAADGLSTLQTIDGGLNNISLLIDRARTLATQSASGTFTGDRSTLDSEFQSIIEEINRQSQAIGLDAGGQFNKALSVFIGGGRANGGVSETQNGAVNIDLSQSAVNASRLGLQGVQALGGTEEVTDIGATSVTSVENVLSDTTNQASLKTAGFSEFLFSGPGFADDGQARLSVNLSGVVDANTLVEAVNNALEGFSATSAAGQAFKDAGISAVVNTDSTGKQQLAFTSSDTAFQVQAGDLVSNALLGNFNNAATNAQGASLTTTLTSGTASGDASAGNTDTIAVKVSGGGLSSPETLNITLTGSETQAQIFSALETAFANNGNLSAAGFQLTTDTDADTVSFSNSLGEKFTVAASGDSENVLGFGSAAIGTGNAATASTYTGGSAIDVSVSGNARVSILIEGSSATSPTNIDVNVVAGTTTQQDVVDQINAAIAADSGLAAAGLQASLGIGNALTVASTTGTDFQLSVNDSAANNILDLGDAGGVAVDGAALVGGTTFTAAGANVSGVTVAVDLDADTVADETIEATLNAGFQGGAVTAANAAGGTIQFTVTNNRTGVTSDPINVAVGAASDSDGLETLIQAALDAELGANTIVVTNGAGGAAAALEFAAGAGANDADFFTINNIQTAGGGTLDLGIANGTNINLDNVTETRLANVLNAAVAGNAALTAAGLEFTADTVAGAVDTSSGSALSFTATNTATGTNIVDFVSGLGTVATAVEAGASISRFNATESGTFAESTIFSGGAQGTSGATDADPTSFSGLALGNDIQSLVVTAQSPTGAVQTLNIDLTNSNAKTLDEAIATINSQIQGSNNSTLQQLVAVKERIDGTNDGIRFLGSADIEFDVGVSGLASGNGINAGTASVLTSDALAGGSTADIGSAENAERAVTLLAEAVTNLATVQADVGRGQNRLQFAIGLATTQITNLSAAESRIRDADLAQEAANLTRAGIAQQAGVAALAQANSAPQAVLALLRG